MDKYNGIYADDVQNPSDLLDVIVEKNDEIERLRKVVKQKNLALQEYGYHYPRCNKLEREANDCSCGFEQALKEE